MKTATKNTFSMEIIQALINRHFPDSKIDSVKLLKGGTFNTLYQINGTENLKNGIVLKTGPVDSYFITDHEKDILRTEVTIYQLIKDLDLPAPQILAYDFSRKEIPCDYFLMEYVDGTPWYEFWPLKNPVIMKELGRYTAKFHSIHNDTFGNIKNANSKLFSSWDEAFIYMVEDAIIDVEKQGLKLPFQEIRKEVYKRRSLLKMVETPCLVNFDMWAGNILLKKERKFKISGMLDFERSFFGDPLASFVSAMLIYDDVEKEGDFIQGYNEINKEPLIIKPSDREKMNLYSILFYLYALSETHRYGICLRLPQRWYITSLIHSLVSKLAVSA